MRLYILLPLVFFVTIASSITCRAMEYSNYDIYNGPHKIDLHFSEKNWNKINSLLDKFRRQRVIMTSNDDYVKGKIILDGITQIKIKARIKGKELDHASDNMSFRIKVDDDNFTHILGMKEFSLQRYERRSTHAPYLHYLLWKSNLISFRYVPVKLSINDKRYHNYIIEDRPTKEFQEYNRKKESALFALSDDETWFQKEINRNFLSKTIILESQRLPIKSYSYSHIKKSKVLEKYSQDGYSLLWGYRAGLLSFEDVFDVRKYLKAVAVADMVCDFHPFIAHINIRYYYNPYLRKIEPVIFDFVKNDAKKDCVIGAAKALKGKYKDLYKEILEEVIKNVDYGEYKRNVNKFGHLKKSNIKENFGKFRDRLSYLKDNLSPPQTINATNITLGYAPKVSFNDNRPYIKPLNLYYIKGYGIRQDEVWIENKTDRIITIDKVYLKNSKKFNLELRILRTLVEGLRIKPHNSVEEIIKIKIDPNMKVKFKKLRHLVADLSYEKSNKTIEEKSKPLNVDIDPNLFKNYREMIGNSDIKRIKVPVSFELALGFPYKKEDIKYIATSIKKTLKYNKFLTLEDNKFAISDKEIRIKKDIIIPDGYSLSIKNSKIKFDEGVRIVVRGAPINIHNSTLVARYKEKGWLGIVVLGAGNNKSTIKDSIISDIKYIDGDIYKNDWILTGAITFYESDVDVISSKLSNNNTEDLLNIISSKFLIKDSTLNNTPSDAFDSDFSNGKIINTNFTNIKGDGVDISGTKLKMIGGRVENVVDKAISIGEISNFSGNKISISDVGAGIVSKDFSRSVIRNSEFKNITNAVYMSFQKKSEYGPAKLRVYNCKSSEYGNLFQMDQNSEIKIDDKNMVGNYIDSNILYQKGSFKKIKW